MKQLFTLPFFLIACSTNIGDLGVNGAVSECGGFSSSPKGPSGPDQDTGSSESYCADDVMSWAYDASEQTLSVLNKGVFLNCCGERAISVTQEDGTYVLTEQDQPEDGDLRCSCMCMFDYAVDVPDLAEGSIDVKLVRAIDDAISTIWEGSLDLSEGSGEVLIEEDAGWCEE